MSRIRLTKLSSVSNTHRGRPGDPEHPVAPHEAHEAPTSRFTEAWGQPDQKIFCQFRAQKQGVRFRSPKIGYHRHALMVDRSQRLRGRPRGCVHVLTVVDRGLPRTQFPRAMDGQPVPGTESHGATSAIEEVLKGTTQPSRAQRDVGDHQHDTHQGSISISTPKEVSPPPSRSYSCLIDLPLRCPKPFPRRRACPVAPSSSRRLPQQSEALGAFLLLRRQESQSSTAKELTSSNLRCSARRMEGNLSNSKAFSAFS